MSLQLEEECPPTVRDFSAPIRREKSTKRSIGARRGWEKRKERDERALREIPPELQALWKRVGPGIKGRSFEERATKFIEYVAEHPGEDIRALVDDADAWLDREIERRAIQDEADMGPGDLELAELAATWAKRAAERTMAPPMSRAA
jgi:hypothetical protein